MSAYKSIILTTATLCFFALGLWISPAHGTGPQPGEEVGLANFCWEAAPVVRYAELVEAGDRPVAIAMIAALTVAGDCVRLHDMAPGLATLERLERPGGKNGSPDVWAVRWHGMTVFSVLWLRGQSI